MRSRVYFILAVAMLAVSVGAGVVWWVKLEHRILDTGSYLSKPGYLCTVSSGKLAITWTLNSYRLSLRESSKLQPARQWNYAGVALTSDNAVFNDGMADVIPIRQIAIDFRVFATLGGLLAVLFYWRYRVARRMCLRKIGGLCPSCGYDLRATPGRCPECGAVPIAG
jgi:hypothetical protein